jgi:hypothetical protein
VQFFLGNLTLSKFSTFPNTVMRDSGPLDWFNGAAKDVGEWTSDVVEDVDNALNDASKDVREWAVHAAKDVGDAIKDAGKTSADVPLVGQVITAAIPLMDAVPVAAEWIATEAVPDAGKWTEHAAEDAAKWSDRAAEDASKWTAHAAHDLGIFLFSAIENTETLLDGRV